MMVVDIEPCFALTSSLCRISKGIYLKNASKDWLV